MQISMYIIIIHLKELVNARTGVRQWYYNSNNHHNNNFSTIYIHNIKLTLLYTN